MSNFLNSSNNGMISINGDVKDFFEAKISPFDRGFLLGDGVFESILSFSKKPLDLREHLLRLEKSCQTTQIFFPWNIGDLEKEILGLLDNYCWQKTYIRIMITRGEGLGLVANKKPKPNKYIYLLPYSSTGKDNALKLRPMHLASKNYKSYPKELNYLFQITQLTTSKSLGFHDLIFYNQKNQITESSTSNIFFIKKTNSDFEIMTPPESSGLLAGIMRKRILLTCQKNKITCYEKNISIKDELPDYQEAFLSSSLRGMVPIISIGSHGYQTIHPHSIFKKLQSLVTDNYASPLSFLES